MMTEQSQEQLELFNLIVSRLSEFDESDQVHMLESVAKWFRLESVVVKQGQASSDHSGNQAVGDASFASTATEPPSPKEFLIEKSPQTNVERVACLAFYLTHFRDTPHFKTLDLSRLNTEAAQPKFSNASVTVNDAAKSGFLVSAGKGNKQLGAIGEQFVSVLPDREGAKLITQNARKRRPRKKSKKTTS